MSKKVKGRSLKAKSLNWHQTIAIFGGIGLLLWGLSGLLHPLMTTFGPQQAVFYPPARPLNLQDIKPVHDILAEAGITKAQAVKVIVSDQQNLLQVTESQDQPRRYFQLNDGRELVGYDQQHAAFLARYYTKIDEDTNIRQITRLENFTENYPPVNRLLPVYKVDFERDDNLSIYVYTETNASAGLSNNFKNNVQAIFRVVHTWSWFPREAEWGRVVLITLFIGSLLALGITGVMMLILIRRKIPAKEGRKFHRLAGYILALPIIMFSASGLYHLIEYADDEPVRNLKLSPELNLADVKFPLHEQWTDLTKGLNVNNLSIVQDVSGQHLYRLGLAPQRKAPTGDAAIRNARFDGVETTGPAYYINATTGETWQNGDKELAIQLGERFTGVDRDAIKNVEMVKRFGSGYDFRNKRLPVWRLDYAAPVNATVFVDTTTGVLADKTADSRKPEQLSFSMLHKWNFLFPVGRSAQNIIISVFVLATIIFMAIIGIQMDLKRRNRGK